MADLAVALSNIGFYVGIVECVMYCVDNGSPAKLDDSDRSLLYEREAVLQMGMCRQRVVYLCAETVDSDEAGCRSQKITGYVKQ